MFRSYVLPTVGSGRGPQDMLRPKYVHRNPRRIDPLGLPLLAGKDWNSDNFGREDRTILSLEVDIGQHLLLHSMPDVVTLPEDSGASLSSEDVARVVAWLDADCLPSSWVSRRLSKRNCRRVIMGIALITQRYYARTKQKLWADMTRRVSELRMAEDLLEVHVDLGLSRTQASGDSTVGELVLHLADQWTGAALYIGGRDC